MIILQFITCIIKGHVHRPLFLHQNYLLICIGVDDCVLKISISVFVPHQYLHIPENWLDNILCPKEYIKLLYSNVFPIIGFLSHVLGSDIRNIFTESQRELNLNYKFVHPRVAQVSIHMYSCLSGNYLIQTMLLIGQVKYRELN